MALAQSARGQFIDSAVCAGCHRKIAESYARTGMGRSFYAVTTDTTLPEFRGVGLFHRGSQEQFTPVRRDAKYFVRRSQPGRDGKPANLLDVQVDFVMGSGNHARSYLHRTSDNRLVEFPVSWYAEQGGRWGMSPGYDRPNHAGFTREVSNRCLFCHNAYPESDTSPAGWDGAGALPERLPQGIDCQRCHGPGRDHVRAAQAGGDLEAVRSAIVNPARLTPERGIEVCLQCHLESTTMQLPATMMRPGRTVFSYRAGEPLSDYILHFDYAAQTGHDRRFDLVSAGYRLLKSACFRGSSGRLTCTTCHNPHQAPLHTETLQKANQACQGCHEAAVTRLASSGKHPSSPICTECHMPKRRAEDAIHMIVTDHAIQAKPEPAANGPIVERNDSNGRPYAGEVALYYPKELTATPENAVALAMAQVRELSNLPNGLEKLEKVVADYKPARAEPYFVLGTALFNVNQAARALPFYQEAARREAGNWRYLDSLARTFLALERADLAIATARQARAAAPGEARTLATLGFAQASHENLLEAAATFRQAVTLTPDSAAALNNLGNMLLRLGDFPAAEATLREAVRFQPEDAAARLNLADALLERHTLTEAGYQLKEAIRIGPSIDLARSAWFADLAATGNIATAQAAYDASMRGQLAEAHATLGSILDAQGDRLGAIREYRMAVAADPRSVAFLASLGLALAARQSAEARGLLEEVVRRKPDLFEVQLKLGELLLVAGQTAPAREHLKRATESPDPRIRQAATELLGRRK